MTRLVAAVVVGAALLASCGETEEPQTDEVTTETGDQEGDQKVPPDPPREFTAGLDLSSPDCERPTLAYRALAFYVDDDSPVTDISCRLELDDGTLSNSCEGTHTFAQGGTHRVFFSVRDNASGFVYSSPDPQGVFVDEPLQLSVRAEAPACGLEFTITPEIVGDLDSLVTLITPAENVVDNSIPRRYVVSEPGTYTVSLIAEQERVGPICTYTASATVAVVACPDEHEHTPDCPH